MPVERIIKEFKDISGSFKSNPLNDDLIAIKNETAIGRSIRNLVLTNPGERFFNQNLGSRTSSLLFEVMDTTSAEILRSEIENTIKNYEPRVNLTNVEVTPNEDTYEFNIQITYQIVGIDALPQKLTFALQSTR